MQKDFLGLKKELPPRRRLLLSILSFVLPLVVWSAVSYIPWLWHPEVQVTVPDGDGFYEEGTRLKLEDFRHAVADNIAHGTQPPQGVRVNPVYLPAPHEVVRALYTAFTTEPQLQGDPWFHEALWHSIRTIFWGFVLSSVVGVPLGILCGSFRFFGKLFEPFIEFFRYLPAPVFGTLCVAILDIYDAPKIAIIWIGTFFQQVLVIANTVRKVDPSLIEAAQTLGARRFTLVRRVILPASIADLYTDMRILLGWAWTYLIIAEVVGTMSGITLFITQQARWRHYDNVYAAILMIGIIGFGSDLLLAKLGTVLFPWKRPRGAAGKRGWIAWIREPGPAWRKPLRKPAPLPAQP